MRPELLSLWCLTKNFRNRIQPSRSTLKSVRIVPKKSALDGSYDVAWRSDVQSAFVLAVGCVGDWVVCKPACTFRASNRWGSLEAIPKPQFLLRTALLLPGRVGRTQYTIQVFLVFASCQPTLRSITIVKLLVLATKAGFGMTSNKLYMSIVKSYEFGVRAGWTRLSAKELDHG